jgi:hypothetical protein
MTTATVTANTTIVHSSRWAAGHLRAAIAAAAILLAGLGPLLPSTAAAATILVNTTADSGPGSLRQAVINAAPGDTVAFDSGLAGQTIILTGGPIIISRNLTISGEGSKITVSRNNTYGIFYVQAGTVVFSHLIIRDGDAGSNQGGGILNQGGDVTVTNCTIADCSAGTGAGIYNLHNLTVTNSTITGNSTTLGPGGGIYHGGLSLTVNNCTFSGNGAPGNFGADIHNAGVTVRVRNSILANKTVASNVNCQGTLATNLNNLIEDGSCATAPPLNVDPLLGPLQDNGGDTPTMALLSGSPAIDQADAATAEATDQRGNNRSGAPDIGAYEAPTLNVALSGPGS